jgi:DNA modification methylase
MRPEDEVIDIIHSDCLEAMRDLPAGSIDACITDPPYGTTNCKWDAVIPFEPMWEQLKRVIKPSGVILLFSAQPFTSALIMSNPLMFKYEWIWHKTRATGHLDAKRKPLKAHESISCFSQSSVPYNPQMVKGKPHVRGPRANPINANQTYNQFNETTSRCYVSDEYYPQTVLKFSSVPVPIHPNEKPVELLRYLVRTYTNAGETVLDFAAGSGTTGVACEEESRSAVLIEKELAYVETCKHRLYGAEVVVAQ